MAGRYEIPDNGWALIEDIVSPPQRTSHPRRDDRQVLNCIFWILGRQVARPARALRPLEDRL